MTPENALVKQKPRLSLLAHSRLHIESSFCKWLHCSGPSEHEAL